MSNILEFTQREGWVTEAVMRDIKLVKGEIGRYQGVRYVNRQAAPAWYDHIDYMVAAWLKNRGAA